MSFDAEMDARRLVVAVGPGGVGKTTVAAALALREAVRGRRVVVLTIDPAKRLAQAMGLEGLGDEIRRVDLGALRAQGVDVKGELSAAMFDQAESMDDLMTRLSPDAATRDGILRNRVYRAMAGSLARSHAYLATERLYEVMNSGQYDLVVLDTPPARNALDILDAPGRLNRFLEEGVVKWFVGKERKGLAGRLLSGGGAAMTKLFAMVVGEELMRETLDFFKVFYTLRDGFRDRADAVQASFRAPTTAFALVSSVDATHLDDARALAQSAASRGVRIDYAIFNRAYERLEADPQVLRVEVDPQLKNELDDLAAADPQWSEALRTALVERVREAAQLNAAGLRAAEELAHELPSSCARRIVPAADHDVRDIPGLWALTPALLDAPQLRPRS